jgi:phosphohistidine phosphatase SixA
MRHALAPFEGAPKEAGMTAEGLGPCATQRNLDDRGRADARRIGEIFRKAGVRFEHVYTSKWCRCRETAELVAGKPVENLPLINSFWTHPQRNTVGPPQIAALKAYLSQSLARTDRFLMVTHGSVIEALTGLGTNESDIVIVRPDGKGGIAVVAYGVP